MTRHPISDTIAPTYTWDTLAPLIGAPTADDREEFAVLTPAPARIAVGNQIASKRILTDLLRWAGQVQSFWPHATDAQKEILLGYSEGLLRVAFAEGQKLRAMVAGKTTDDTTRATALVANTAAADESFQRALHARERLHAALRALAAPSTPLGAQIAESYGTAGDAEALSASLDAQIGIARGLLAHPTTPAARRLRKGHVTAASLDALAQLARDAKTHGASASGARTHGAVSQADLDAQDGTCLALMRQLMDTFNAGHDEDTAIPHLVPIATRTVLGPHPHHPSAVVTPPAAGAPAAGTATPAA